MKASVSPRLLVAVLCLAAGSAMADTVMRKGQPPAEGEILSVAGGNIKIKIGPVETAIPLAQVTSVTKPAPKTYTDALAIWQTGNAEKTLAALKPVVDTFRGLPTPWAEQASALLGEVYLALDQIPAAETAFADFQKAYPNAGSLAAVGLSRLAVSRKDFANAKARLEPIIAESGKVTFAESGKSTTYGQAHYLMGQINENAGAYPEALRNYLTAVTLFYEDKAVAAKAQERANVLIEKKIIVP